MTAETDDRVLSQKELAQRWNLTPRTLQNWNRDGKGPKRVKIGKWGYRLSDVVAFEKSHVIEPGTTPDTNGITKEISQAGVAKRKQNREARKAEQK